MKRPGEILGDRFVLESSIGAGGMGTVYRAIDSTTGRRVAVKIARAEKSDEDHRFASEIGLLAELSHPGIVGYVAHGTTVDGRPFLAMELLEGEDLGARLVRGPLSIDDAIAVVRGAALALVEPHRRGIVHRDLKPSNLFLRGGLCDQIVVLDFGIARGGGQQSARTATGLVVGTPEYMAPEQAQGLRDVNPTADVFALGCVLYECLAGVSPFGSAHLAATLAKVLFEEPRALESLRPDVPAPLARLVRAMLVKERDARVKDANALLRELDRLGLEQSGERAAPSSGLGRDEIELVTVLLATPDAKVDAGSTLEAGPSTFAARGSEIARRELRMPDVILEPLGDGSLLVVLGRQGESPADQAMAAIRCAHVLRAALPEARVAVTSARRVAGSRTAFGDAVARAGSLLSETSGVQLDELTAALVAPADATRLLLGKPTPCVGRAQELSTLESLVATAFDERVSRAALVVAPAGVGKSRLRHELLRRLEGREHLRFSARGELLGAGSPYGIVGSALRAAFGIRAEDDLSIARARVEEGVRRLGPGLSDETTALLGELCDAPFDDESRTGLRAARQDPRVMHAKLSDACVAFLRAVSERPVLFVVDDLHWGDKPSIELLGRALSELEERPFCVLSFARPEAQEHFGEIWPGRALSLALTPLHRRACQQLVERVAGDRLDAATIARIVTQSAGNALWLEELVRAAEEGELEAPDTVLAMVQTRIGRLDPSARRVLRAGSVFGERFPRDGVLTLLGASSDALRLDELLSDLVAREIVEPVPDTGRHRFRHALVRDAIYAMLTEDDRKLGHRLAGEWLEHREPDPSVLAEHFLLADEPARAAPFLLRATERAYERDDFDAALRLARRIVGRPMPDVITGELASLEAATLVMRWDWIGAGQAAKGARALLPEGSRGWIRALRVLGTTAAYQHRDGELTAIIEDLLSVEARPDTRIEYGDTLLHMSSTAAQTGLTGLSRSVFERARTVLADVLHRYPNMHAWQDQICCTMLRHTDDDLATQVFLLREAERLYEVIGGSRAMLILARDTLGEALARAGQLDEAERLVRETFAEARRIGARYLVSHGALALATVLATRGEVTEVEALMQELLAVPGITEGYRGMAQDALAQAASSRGDHAAAERFARVAIECSQHTPVRRWLMVAHLGDALLGQGRGAEAHEACRRAVEEMDRVGGGGYAETSLLLSTAEAALSIGELREASALVARTKARLTEQASSFIDPTAFADFLRTAPGTARLRALEARLASA